MIKLFNSIYHKIFKKNDLDSLKKFCDDKQYVDTKKCIPFRDTVIETEEMPESPGDVFKLAERYCKKGSKMHIESIPDWWVQYVIYNVCDMKYSIHVERFKKREEALASIICLYEGKMIYN